MSRLSRKNQLNNTAGFMAVMQVQSALGLACLRNGLRFVSTITMREIDKKQTPILIYGVGFHEDVGREVFEGEAQRPNEPQVVNLIDFINGKMVSELFPPTLREAAIPGAIPGEFIKQRISHWKRRLIMEHDITENGLQTDVSRPTNTMSVWCGYNNFNAEIIRVPDGAKNNAPEDVVEIRHMAMGLRGTCVLVIHKDQVVTGSADPATVQLLKKWDKEDPKPETSSSMSMSSSASVSSLVMSSAIVASTASVSLDSSVERARANLDQAIQNSRKGNYGRGVPTELGNVKAAKKTPRKKKSEGGLIDVAAMNKLINSPTLGPAVKKSIATLSKTTKVSADKVHVVSKIPKGKVAVGTKSGIGIVDVKKVVKRNLPKKPASTTVKKSSKK